MITLYAFGPRFGLPDASPFVTKAEVLLKMSGLPYRRDTRGFRKAPKGKLPYIDDDGFQVGDSTFIRMHLQRRYDIDFDAGLSPSERGVAWAFEKMCEDHLYWAVLHARWMIDANFDAGSMPSVAKVWTSMGTLAASCRLVSSCASAVCSTVVSSVTSASATLTTSGLRVKRSLIAL